MRSTWFGSALLALAVAAPVAHAEPMFLSRQYTRCTTCHYSQTGGGLLTPYGRSLSHNDLSTTGGGGASGEEAKGGEHEFLFGALGDALGPVMLGIDARPGQGADDEVEEGA